MATFRWCTHVQPAAAASCSPPVLSSVCPDFVVSIAAAATASVPSLLSDSIVCLSPINASTSSVAGSLIDVVAAWKERAVPLKVYGAWWCGLQQSSPVPDQG